MEHEVTSNRKVKLKKIKIMILKVVYLRETILNKNFNIEQIK